MPWPIRGRYAFAGPVRRRLMIPLPPTWPIFWLLPRLGFGEGVRVYRRPETTSRYRPAC
jgi:hypothetical protein